MRQVIRLGLLVLGLWLSGLVDSDAAICPKYEGTTKDTRGNVIAGTSVTVRQHGTTTSAQLYSDAFCLVPIANPVLSNASGIFNFFVVDGRYDFVFSKDRHVFNSPTHVSIFSPVGNYQVLLSYFASKDICLASSGAIDAIGSTTTTLIIDVPATCSGSKTVPSTLTLSFTGQGQVDIALSQTLTLNSCPIALDHRTIWTGSGSVAWGTMACPNPYGKDGIVLPTYGANVTVDTTLGQWFILTVTNNSAFAMGAPTANFRGCLKITIKNTTGGAIATPTWNAVYKKPTFTSPGAGQQRTWPFCYDGTNWIFLTDDADTPN